ncbi:MAG TPA: lipase family protein [Pirellulaceae bacterium]|nr:lipase family protein [Pirellulaceae bacterium]HMO93549.1 lipase family protein [Pirellulaceae bacterium]HMP70339.1 lipase family protein [Pirellulaceae bacterium]
MSDSVVGLKLDANANHDESHATYLGRACELAYLDAKQGSIEFRKQLGLDAELISISNTQAYIGENDGAIVVAFRGSESFTTIDGFKDWLLTNARNFLILPEGRIGTDFAAAGVGARFHSGFMSALNDIWDPLFAKVDNAYSECERPVWLTGHSLGGALALLCAWRLHQHFVAVHQICTFGAPMIGNDIAAEAFKREFPSKIYRYVDIGDIVPKLPTISLFSNSYAHCDTEIVVGEATEKSALNCLKETAAQTVDGAINSLVANSLWSEVKKGMPSHLMGNYLSRLTSKRRQ